MHPPALTIASHAEVLDLDLDLLYGPNPTDYPRTSANVGATKRRAE